MDNKELPQLTFRKGTSGLEIAAAPSFEADMVEFTLRAGMPQAVFISPWIQFEDPRFTEWRSKLAMEIIRRATGYDALVAECKRLKENNDDLWESNRRLSEERP